ncbi:MAG: DUF255 domain-containing protein [Planctomycetes bacterium]|nr:DUF255 domain-containing protein [Planctomycetota bacterium]
MKEQLIFLFICVSICYSMVASAQEQGPEAAGDGRNHLGETTSPYLLQHQYNPVHWYPWGEEAFAAARTQGKPIFLSIGYSTCYWCHVMERECFEDQEVADVLNKDFIAVKVDREERPDVDEIYMTALQLMSRGRGGWPISLFLEPYTLKPIWGATYLSKRDFMHFMSTTKKVWAADEQEVLDRADEVARVISSRLTTLQSPVQVSPEIIETGAATLLSRFDAKLGGFSGRPKFPMPIYSDYLMETSWDNPQVQKAVKKTLDSMLMGGMYDQVGGGFHRYSTDAKWLVPHFEKMLYDNGQLVSTYAKAYELTGEATYAKVIEETLDYVNRELNAPDGGFFSAQDAETNHLEGETYLWREAEIRKVLEDAEMEDEIDFALTLYGVSKGTNFQDPHHPEVPPTNVLYLGDHPVELAKKYGMSYPQYQARVDALDAALLAVRDTRDQPLTDDKIITAWNGIMITGFADAGRILQNDAWIDRAMLAAKFILTEMKLPNGKLLRTWREGKAGADAFLIDYASFIRGLLAIYRANQDQHILSAAIELYDTARELFYVKGQGWFDTEEGKSDLFVRTRALSDGAIPAATSYILDAVISLSEFTGEERFEEDVMGTIDSESQWLSSQPLSVIVAAKNFDRWVKAHPEEYAKEPIDAMQNDSTVKMSCNPDRITLSAGEPSTIFVKLQMDRGWHVNSNEPGNEYTVPLSFTSIDDNLSLEITWPESVKMVSAGESVSVFGDVVTIPIKLIASPKAKGKMSIMARWQSCNEDTCLAQEDLRVPCTIIVE